MPLTGQKKVDYQRDYMRRRRSNRSVSLSEADGSNRPEKVTAAVRPTPSESHPGASGAIEKVLSSPAAFPKRRHALKMGFEAIPPAQEVDADGEPIPDYV